jgi:probable phosphoglycerate mutase
VKPKRLRVIVEADGGARGNPGPAGYGAVVREAATGEVLVERAEAIGVATNNVAEYRGLIAGLQAAADLGAVEVDVRMDSKLVVEQMSGRWQIKHPGLRPLAAQAAALVRRFEVVRFGWIPRERNRRADALANAAMDGKSVSEVDLAGLSPADAADDLVRPEPVRPGQRTGWAPPASGPATRLVLVRHGETELTAQRRYSGRHDVPLSAQGIAQAEATAARVAALGSADVVVSSPLSRCVSTAEAIAARVGSVPVEREPDLIECDFGEWEGLTFAEVRERWPDVLDRWLASASVPAPGGESLEAVGKRVGAFVPRLLERYGGATVVVVSHVTPIKMILRDALDAGDAFLYRLFLDPTGLSIVDYWSDGGVAVRAINDTAHLADL